MSIHVMTSLVLVVFYSLKLEILFVSQNLFLSLINVSEVCFLDLIFAPSSGRLKVDVCSIHSVSK